MSVERKFPMWNCLAMFGEEKSTTIRFADSEAVVLIFLSPNSPDRHFFSMRALKDPACRSLCSVWTHASPLIWNGLLSRGKGVSKEINVRSAVTFTQKLLTSGHRFSVGTSNHISFSLTRIQTFQNREWDRDGKGTDERLVAQIGKKLSIDSRKWEENNGEIREKIRGDEEMINNK